MKTIPSSRVRLACRVVRQWSGVVAGGVPRHAESCPDCRAYFAAGAALDGAMQRDARALAQRTPLPSVGFERRVINAALQPSAAAAVERRQPWRVGQMAAAALAVVAVAAFFRPVGSPTSAANEADAAMLANAVGTVSRGLVETVIPTAGEFAANNPLQWEFDAIYSDARSVVGFLALNFLPNSPAGTTPPITRSL